VLRQPLTAFPDLGMARLRDLRIDTTTIPGHRLLRFTTVIVNTGASPFETIGRRSSSGTTQMSVTQRISVSRRRVR
jgi:hypothetical protein